MNRKHHFNVNFERTSNLKESYYMFDWKWAQ